MKTPLTPRQHEILRHIATSIRQSGIVPSIREIGSALGMRSPSTVHQHLAALERKGYVRRDGERMRVLELTDRTLINDAETVRLPLVGRVSAGTPVLAEEHVEDMIPIPRRFVGWDNECFLLAVRGESMIGAGIFPGDLVIVRCQQVADPGDLVVALLGDEATVKRFGLEHGRPLLRPENPVFQPIRDQFELVGKVVGLIRRYPMGDPR